MSVKINITGSVKTATKYPLGSDFTIDGQAYQLVIHNTNEGHLAALVNRETGESIHKLKDVANAGYVTASELKSMNFGKSPAAVCVE